MITKSSAAPRDRRVTKSPSNWPEVAKNLPPKFQNRQALLKIQSICRPTRPSASTKHNTTSPTPAMRHLSSTRATRVAIRRRSYVDIARLRAKYRFETHRIRTGTVSFYLCAYTLTMRKRYIPPRTSKTAPTRISKRAGAETVCL